MTAWIACNLLGWFAAAAIALALQVPGSPLNSPVMLIVVVVPPALAQWLVLHRLRGVTPLWLATIPIGCIVFIAVLTAIPAGAWQLVDDEGIGTISLLYALLGALIGLGQWLILRRHFGSAGIWVGASAVALGLGFAIVLSTGLINRSEFLAYTAVMLVYVILSGAALGWLLLRGSPTQLARAA
jgi:hypothetical protein